MAGSSGTATSSWTRRAPSPSAGPAGRGEIEVLAGAAAAPAAAEEAAGGARFLRPGGHSALRVFSRQKILNRSRYVGRPRLRLPAGLVRAAEPSPSPLRHSVHAGGARPERDARVRPRLRLLLRSGVSRSPAPRPALRVRESP